MTTRAAKSKPKANRFAALEATLGYAFIDSARLALALTHRSFIYESRGFDWQTAERNAERPVSENGVDNEQFEFLGDAVLGVIVAEALLARFPQCSEGELTQMRAALVSRKRLGALGATLALGDHMIFGQSAERAGARTKPALLANAVEAVIGALYLDGGLDTARDVVERILLDVDNDRLKAAIAAGPSGALRDAKTQLQERVQATAGAGRMRYVDAGEAGPAHQRRFRVEAVLEAPDRTRRVLAEGEGSTKKEAQQRAAEAALTHWNAPAGDLSAA